MRASASSSVTRRRERSYSFAFSIACATCDAIVSSSSTSSSCHSRGCGGAHVHGAGQALGAVEDRHGEQRLEPLLVEAGEAHEAGIGARVGGDRDRLALARGVARQALAGAHPRQRRGVVEMGAVHRLQHELVGRPSYA